MESTILTQNNKSIEITKQVDKPELALDVQAELQKLLTKQGLHLNSCQNFSEMLATLQIGNSDTQQSLQSYILDKLTYIYQQLFMKSPFQSSKQREDFKTFLKQKELISKCLLKIFRNVLKTQTLLTTEHLSDHPEILSQLKLVDTEYNTQLIQTQQNPAKENENEKNNTKGSFLEEIKAFQNSKQFNNNDANDKSDKVFIKLIPKSESTWQVMMKIDNYPRLEVKISKNQTIKYIKEFLAKKWLKKFPNTYKINLYPNPEFRQQSELDNAKQTFGQQIEFQHLPLSENYMLLDILAAYHNSTSNFIQFMYELQEMKGQQNTNFKQTQQKESSQFILGQTPLINLNQFNQTQVQFFLQQQSNSSKQSNNENSNDQSNNYSFQKSNNTNAQQNNANNQNAANAKPTQNTGKKKKIIAQKQHLLCNQQNNNLTNQNSWQLLKQQNTDNNNNKNNDNNNNNNNNNDNNKNNNNNENNKNKQNENNFPLVVSITKSPFEDQQEKFESQRKYFIESRQQSQGENEGKVAKSKKMSEGEDILQTQDENSQNRKLNFLNAKEKISLGQQAQFSFDQKKMESELSNKKKKGKKEHPNNNNNLNNSSSDSNNNNKLQSTPKIIINETTQNSQINNNNNNNNNANELNESINVHKYLKRQNVLQANNVNNNTSNNQLINNKSNNNFGALNFDTHEQALQKNLITDSINFSNIKGFNDYNSLNYSNISQALQYLSENTRQQINYQQSFSNIFKDQEISQFKYQTPNNVQIKQQTPSHQRKSITLTSISPSNNNGDNENGSHALNEKNNSILFEENNQKNKYQIEEIVSKIGEASSFANQNASQKPISITNITDKIKRQSTQKK